MGFGAGKNFTEVEEAGGRSREAVALESGGLPRSGAALGFRSYSAILTVLLNRVLEIFHYLMKKPQGLKPGFN